MMFSIQEDNYTLPTAYDYFCDEFENMLSAAFGIAPAREGLGETQSDAKDLLRNSQLPVEQIAATCGFGSYINLYKEFKKHEHCSPAKWRSINS